MAFAKINEALEEYKKSATYEEYLKVSLVISKASELLFQEFPDFTVDDDDKELAYIVAGWFTKYILERYNNGDVTTFAKGMNFIEKLHHSEEHKIRELAAIGYLESIQNTYPKEFIESNKFFGFLGDKSRIWWDKLNRFWDGDAYALREDELCS